VARRYAAKESFVNRVVAQVVVCSLLVAGAARAASAVPMTPLHEGFHQLLKCNGGYLTVDVGPVERHDAAPPAVMVATAIAVGPALNKTRAIREVEHDGSITSLGYMTDKGFKRFPKRVLLPAAPPKAGEVSQYFNITGDMIEKRYDGPAQGRDGRGKPAPGFAFSDYVKGHKLNTIVYVPDFGISEARFYGLANGQDLVCRPEASKG
jgi:hypothetical protein